MSKGQCGQVTDQETLDRSVFSKDHTGGGFQKAWTDFNMSIKKKADMKILEQCGCKESGILPVKMQYLLNFHFKELETALYNELLKLKCNVECVKPGDQCLSIEVKNDTDKRGLEYVISVLCDEVNKVNYCQSIQASKHPELLLKEYIDRGHLAIYMDDEKVFVVGIVENPTKVIEMLMKKPTSTDNGSTAADKMDVQLDNPFKCQLLIQFLPSLKQKHPSVNVTMDEEKKIMSVCGNNRYDVQAAVEDVHLFTKDFVVEDITVDPLLIQLLKLQDIKTFIKELCEEQDLKVIWTLSELSSKITCHCKDKKAVQDFCDVLYHNLEKKTYSMCFFSEKNVLSDFLREYEGICLVSTPDAQRKNIDIFTRRNIGKEMALLELTFKDTKIDIQKKLTQDETKKMHNQTSATRKEDTTEKRTEVETSVLKVPKPHQEQMLKKFDFKALSDELSTNVNEYNKEHLIENLQTPFPGKRTLRPAEINIRGKLVDQKGNGSFNQQTFGEENLRKSTKADKLGTTVKHGDLDDCVICMEPPTLPRKLHCDQPTCGSIQGVVTGDQPPGTMKVRTSVLSLPGHHQCGRIEIEYVIHPGKQAAEHPNEGQWYEGIEKNAYLPNTKDGRKIAKLLGVAFDRKLIFTIGHSRTTGKQGVVKWNDIHHKTNPKPGTQFGYPDDTYFDRVLDELRIKGVTEKDL